MHQSPQVNWAESRRCPECRRGAGLGVGRHFIDPVAGPVRVDSCRWCPYEIVIAVRDAPRDAIALMAPTYHPTASEALSGL